jgi:single-stranded-DNA-specific exonuclease
MSLIVQRDYSSQAAAALIREGFHPVFARVYAARGIHSAAQLADNLSALLTPSPMKHLAQAANFLADAVAGGKRLLIIADYDADGATACAVGMLGLGAMGARVDYLVPNRFEYGYGLTPEIVHLAAERPPDILITVDNGIASVAGVAEARKLGMEVLITDHHLPGDQLPDALIVNPNQPGCGFPSKNLAGVGVMFYVLTALRAELRIRGKLDNGGPNLAALLDLVALGTVADVVRLDENNRILVSQGLQRIRAGQCRPGIQALFQVAGRSWAKASTYDLGFVLGPRLNAAGRLADMTVGIECLLASDLGRASIHASELDHLNRERKQIETGMQENALAGLEDIAVDDSYSLSLFQQDWHQGVIGILASRLKEKYHRPVIAFARGDIGELKGSGRATRGLHLRDALDLIDKRHPGLILKFGGHAAAAGLTIHESGFGDFRAAFENVARELLSPADLTRVIETDGELPDSDHSFELARALSGQVWGQGFPAPSFEGEFRVVRQRMVGEKHLKLELKSGGKRHDAILFNQPEPLPERIRAVYRLEVNEYRDTLSLQLNIEHWEAA